MRSMTCSRDSCLTDRLKAYSVNRISRPVIINTRLLMSDGGTHRNAARKQSRSFWISYGNKPKAITCRPLAIVLFWVGLNIRRPWWSMIRCCVFLMVIRRSCQVTSRQRLKRFAYSVRVIRICCRWRVSIRHFIGRSPNWPISMPCRWNIGIRGFVAGVFMGCPMITSAHSCHRWIRS